MFNHDDGRAFIIVLLVGILAAVLSHFLIYGMLLHA